MQKKTHVLSTEQSKKIIIFDTSLRDGEQSPGASMTVEEKIKIAKQLEILGVDVIEAGFPIISDGDFFAVSEIAKQIKNTTICALARCNSADVIAAGNALSPAKSKRIHLFIATSEIHMKHKLNKSKKQVIDCLVAAIHQAKRYTDDIEFSAEDATRSDIKFLIEVYSKAIAAGATTINVPDTVGYITPNEYTNLIKTLQQKVVNIDKVNISVHCHNDLGLATANSLAAIQAGAVQVECTINGIGERSGNCALEEIVMGLKTRIDTFCFDTNINTKELLNTSRLVSEVTGMSVQANKAIVGDNAFSHEAGIHQHGVIKHRETYEIMRAEDVGFSSNHLVIGKHSGIHAINEWLKQHQIYLSDEDTMTLTQNIKTFADRYKSISDYDIYKIIKNNFPPDESSTSHQRINQFLNENDDFNQDNLIQENLIQENPIQENPIQENYMSARRW